MVEIRRIVPVLTIAEIESEAARYRSVFGLSEVMNHGWIVTLADESSGREVSLMTRDLTAAVNPDVSIEVDDVDAAHAAALASGLEIVHELQNEDWGVRRFFFRDGAGNVVNVLSHK